MAKNCTTEKKLINLNSQGQWFFFHFSFSSFSLMSAVAASHGCRPTYTIGHRPVTVDHQRSEF
jgi:hypothetical protein